MIGRFLKRLKLEIGFMFKYGNRGNAMEALTIGSWSNVPPEQRPEWVNRRSREIDKEMAEVAAIQAANPWF